jgi:hypothetical protein
VTGEGLSEGIKDGAALLAPGRTDRADAAEGVRASLAAERARHLLLDFDHAQVAFRLIVVEGYGEVVEEAQRLVLIGPKPIEKIAYWRLLPPAASSHALRWRQGILGESCAEERLGSGR